MIKIAKAMICGMVAVASVPATAEAPYMEIGTPDAGPVEAPQGSVEIPLYGKKTPGSPSDTIAMQFMGRENVLRNISYPTITPVLPDPDKANGTAVIVAPGGGFMMLSMQNEGWRIANMLADHGVTAFVLKYRLHPTSKDDNVFFKEIMKLFQSKGEGEIRRVVSLPESYADGRAAVQLVRTRATEWSIDPDRVGILGFSAGAMTALQTVLQAEDESQYPNFLGYIYGPMDSVAVPKGAPPMFAALAMDDNLFGKGNFAIVTDWYNVGSPVELHAYERGGHGFGMGMADTTSTLMMPEFLGWMDMHGLLSKE